MIILQLKITLHSFQADDSFTLFILFKKNTMFLFESSKEKAIREDVEKSMENCISNPKKYNEAKDILVAHLRGSDQKVI
jgi:cell division GTPase FtsZ